MFVDTLYSRLASYPIMHTIRLTTRLLNRETANGCSRRSVFSAFQSSVERVYSVRYLAKSSVRRVIISDMAALCLDIIYAPCSNKFIIDRWFFHANPRRPFAARVQT